MARKSLYLTGRYPVPSETFIQQEMELLREAGVSIIPVAIFRNDGEGTIKDMRYLTKASRGQDNEEDASPAYVSKVKALVKGPLRRVIALTRHKASIQALVEIVRTEQVDHIHGAFGGLPAVLSAMVAKACGVPYSISVHANDGLCSPYDDSFMLEKADRVFCCNMSTMKQLIERSPWTEDKTVYCPHGLRIEDWPMRKWGGCFNSPLRFLYVGRLTAKKDPQRAYELVHCLNRAGIPAELTFVGDGPLRTPEMTVTGYLPRTEVNRLMQESDFLISTSKELPDGDMEGVPNVVLEAMAVGLPVIAPLTGGIGEVLNTGTGYPVDTTEASDFIAQVKLALANVSGCQSRLECARGAVLAGFSARQAIQQKVDYFNQV